MTIFLAILKQYWSQVALGFAIVGAALVILLLRGELAAARGERDVARAQYITVEAAFENEKLAAKEAADAADRLERENAEQAGRSSSAMSDLRAESARYRVQLSKCVTPEAVADRMGELFP